MDLLNRPPSPCETEGEQHIRGMKAIPWKGDVGQMKETAMRLYTKGEGQTLLFLHGLGSSHHCWSQAVEILKSDYHCCSLDLYGHGALQTPPDLPTIETTVATIGNLLHQVKWKPAAIVGHNLGGVIALTLALKDPRCTQRLVLIDTPTRQMSWRWIRTLSLTTLRKHFKKAVTKQFSRMTRDEDLSRELVQEALDTDQEAYLSYMESVLQTDLKEQIRDIQLPVHIWMTRSLAPDFQTFNRVLSRFGYSHIPEIQRHHSPEYGHFMMMESPEAFGEMLDAMIQRQTGAQNNKPRIKHHAQKE